MNSLKGSRGKHGLASRPSSVGHLEAWKLYKTGGEETCQKDINSDQPKRYMGAIIQRRVRLLRPENIKRKKPMKSKHESTRTMPNCRRKQKIHQKERVPRR